VSVSRTHRFVEDEHVHLVVAGAGIKLVDHITTEARAAVQSADVVLHSTQIPGMAEWLRNLNDRCFDLTTFYAPGRDRWETYARMTGAVLAEVAPERRVCALFYGHPAVYVTPSHDMIRRTRQRGLVARMLPGVSAEDCLFADLGVDPGVNGWQSYDVTPFLVYRPRYERTAGLVLWQMDVLGHRSYQPQHARSNYEILARELARVYGDDHEIIGYYAAQYPGLEPMIDRLTVSDLSDHDGMSTLYVPPVGRPPADRDMLVELGMLDAAAGAAP
jgi:uncharacterized protein YabN with tetrapyrrole methylase and pyrophosphatase domain